ncbi:MAG: hypothetical protein HZA52_16675 [Planctomycetes bacterium]|nr:hypothetical protein [Planctomycetota bacterium]
MTPERNASRRWPLVLAGGALLGAAAMFFAREVLDGRGHEVVARETGAAPREAGEVRGSDVLAEPGPARTHLDVASERVAVLDGGDPARAAADASDLLLAWVARGRAEGWLHDQQLAEIIFWQLVGQGRYEDAWELALRHAPEQQHLYLNLASHAHRSGAFALRDRALEHALALGWVDPSFLAEIDANLALARYDQMIAGAEPTDRLALQVGYAQLLIELGRTDEALAIACSRLANHPNDEAAIDVLCRLDLTAGEAHLRRLIAARDPQNDWTRKLIGLLGENGRPAEAAQWLETLQSSGQPVHASDWGELGDAFIASGDTAGAVDAWLVALGSESGDPDEWTNPLSQYAPDKLLAALEARVSTGEHDEFWGALADARWKSGKTSAAIDAWKQAAALDPSDNEWLTKLALAEAGKDPFGD